MTTYWPQVRWVMPRLHVFSQNPEGAGVLELEGIRFLNASICDGRYQPVNAPSVVDL